MDDERVAVAVQQRSAIYDKNNPKHRNRDVVKMLWKECAAEVGVSEVEVIKKRWGYLRDYFTKQYRDKMKAAAKQPGQALKRTKWPLYETMSFLIPYIEHRETDQRESYDGSEPLSMHVEAVCDDQQDSEEELSYDDNNSGPSRDQSEDTDHLSSKNVLEHPKLEHPVKYEYTNRKRPNDNSFSSRPKRLMSSEQNPLVLSALREASVNDDDDYFFKSLKPMLRQLDPLRKLHFRTEVLKLLMNFLQSPSSTSSSSFI